MISVSALPLDALTTVGAVLVEAIILYVGYGVLTSAVGSRVTAALTDQ